MVGAIIHTNLYIVLFVFFTVMTGNFFLLKLIIVTLLLDAGIFHLKQSFLVSG